MFSVHLYFDALQKKHVAALLQLIGSIKNHDGDKEDNVD